MNNRQQDHVLNLRESPELTYKLYKPSQLITPFVRCFWVLKKGSPTNQPELMLPDGYVDMVFNLGERYQRREIATENRTAVTESHIVGQRTRTVYLAETTKVHLVGVKLRPFALQLLTNIPANEFNNQLVPLTALTSQIAEIEEQLRNLSTDDAQIHHLEQVLEYHLFGHQQEPTLDFGVQKILRTHGKIPITRLSAQLNMSRRTFERSFLQSVGMSPKQFAKVIRFKATFKHFKQNALAMQQQRYLDFGYYDQNHFIKDFKNFIDNTPSAYFAQFMQHSNDFLGMGIEKNSAHWLNY